MRIAIQRKCRTRTNGWSIKGFRSLFKLPISISADIFLCYFCVIYIYSCYLYTFVYLCVMFSFSNTRIFYRGYPGLQLIVLAVFAIVD